jgi:hypothetical protein
MQSSSLSLSAFQTAAWLYIGVLVLVGGGALFGLCADLLAIAVQLVRTLLAQPVL